MGFSQFCSNSSRCSGCYYFVAVVKALFYVLLSSPFYLPLSFFLFYILFSLDFTDYRQLQERGQNLFVPVLLQACHYWPASLIDPLRSINVRGLISKMLGRRVSLSMLYCTVTDICRLLQTVCLNYLQFYGQITAKL